MQIPEITIESVVTVTAFLKALNAGDFKKARRYLSDDVNFIGVMGTRDGGDNYISDMEKMKFKYDIKKIWGDEDDVAVFYDIDMGKATIFCSGWYHLSNGKINAIKVIFDPRPLLEGKK
jgi:limonene-1,2-epoxide hydrolase